jgi:hypothetical protein
MKTLIGLYVRLIYAYRALQQIKRPHLGDNVTYQGKEYVLIQGVCAPYWDLFDWDERARLSSIHESKFQLQPLWRRLFFSFGFTYRFYIRSWFDIDVRAKCNSYSKNVFRASKVKYN